VYAFPIKSKLTIKSSPNLGKSVFAKKRNIAHGSDESGYFD
jgi:hypothetical protein